ncbi:DGQHR domain-containing protein [Mycobacterium marinum]|nr:DGQHR domain-containing protein [Mycobacterium marinum]MDC8992416.1 DGQHR domain-containing protein [Mycobacterium marinum]WDZ15723.1 DGQHR domain-containing protein [Mycobacterium marinum]
MTRVRLHGAIAVQRGTPMLQGFATPQLLSDQGEVDVHDTESDRGYQRSLVTARVKHAAEYYRTGGRMPNSLLVNIREEDWPSVKVVVNGAADEQAAFEDAIESGENWVGVGYIEFDADLKLWVYDGQHRRAGLIQLLKNEATFDDFPAPISLTMGLDTAAEMKEFYEVNTNAKNVSTNLAFTLLSKMAEDDPDLRDALAGADRDWITRGQAVMKELQKLDGPWKDRFQLANVRKRRGDGVIMPMQQFVRSLKPVLDMPLLKRADPETIANIINAYWRGIQTVLPEPFENPEDYQIQKGQGSVALHKVLPQVVEVIRSRGGKLGDPASYAEVMADLPALQGTVVIEGNQVSVDRADYWRTGSVASAFSGDAGRRRLAMLIQSLLPKPSDTITL